MKKQFTAILLAIAIVFTWLFLTVIQLQHDHSIMCENVRQTPFTNAQNWGC